MKVWDIKTGTELLRLNTKQTIKKIKSLVLDDEWFLQAIHNTDKHDKKGVSLFNLQNHRSRLTIPTYEDNFVLLQNPSKHLLLCSDYKTFVQVNAESQLIKKTVSLNSKHVPERFLSNSFVLCKTTKYINVEEKMFLNINQSEKTNDNPDEMDNDDDSISIKPSMLVSYVILNLNKLDDNNQPERKMLFETHKGVACYKLSSADPKELLGANADSMKIYDLYIILHNFEIKKTRFLLKGDGEGSIEVLLTPINIMSMNQGVLFSITDAKILKKRESDYIIDQKNFENTNFQLEKLLKDETHDNRTSILVNTNEIDYKELINTKNLLDLDKTSSSANEFNFLIDDVYFVSPNFEEMVIVIRVQRTRSVECYVAFFDIDKKMGSSFMIPFTRKKTLGHLDHFFIRKMKVKDGGKGKSRFFAFGRLGVVVFDLVDGRLEIQSYRSYKDQKRLKVEYFHESEMFFIMTDFKVEIWNSSFTLNLHSFKSGNEYFFIFLNDEHKKLLIYSKIR